jgi:hypothetical protein
LWLGVATLLAILSFITGAFAQQAQTAVQLSGGPNTQSYIELPGSVTYHSSTGISLSAWIKWDGKRYSSASAADWMSVIFKGNFSSGAYGILISRSDSNSSNEIRCYYGSGAYISYTVTSGLDTNWHHIACTIAPSPSNNVKIYLDGSVVANQAITFSITDNTAWPLRIGGHNGSQYYYFGGLIDDVRIHSSAVASTEISGFYNSGNGTCQNTGALSFYYPLDGHATNMVGTSGDYTNIVNASWSPSGKLDCRGGKFGRDSSNNETTTHLELADSSSLDPSTTMTVEAWFKWDGTAAGTPNDWMSIVSKGT